MPMGYQLGQAVFKRSIPSLHRVYLRIIGRGLYSMDIIPDSELLNYPYIFLSSINYQPSKNPISANDLLLDKLYHRAHRLIL